MVFVENDMFGDKSSDRLQLDNYTEKKKGIKDVNINFRLLKFWACESNTQSVDINTCPNSISIISLFYRSSTFFSFNLNNYIRIQMERCIRHNY